MLSVLAVRALTWLGSGLGLRTWWDGGSPVVRRDRSLAGREVVIGRRFGEREVDSRSSRGSVNPLSPPKGSEVKSMEALRKRPVKREQLPKWWPESVASPVVSVGNQEYQAEANRLVRAIMDGRMSGNDFKDDDIIQLRRICRISGARVSFETANVRVSFYRAAVDLVLNSCSRLIQPSATVLVDGEEARQFICGLAENIGLENVHAARLVRAAVAARTRASLLQSWALEVQGRRLEALEELSKIHQLYLVFPPEDSSPEMEMVASGLKKNLGVEQREHLLNLFKGLGGAEVQSIAAEALGLRKSST